MSEEIFLLKQPGKINNMVTRNRIVMSSAITNMAAPDGSVTEQMIAYYTERGRGGARDAARFRQRAQGGYLPPLGGGGKPGRRSQAPSRQRDRRGCRPPARCEDGG